MKVPGKNLEKGMVIATYWADEDQITDVVPYEGDKHIWTDGAYLVSFVQGEPIVLSASGFWEVIRP